MPEGDASKAKEDDILNLEVRASSERWREDLPEGVEDNSFRRPPR